MTPTAVAPWAMPQTSPQTPQLRTQSRSLHMEVEQVCADKNQTIETFAAKKWSEIFRLHTLLSKSFAHIPLAGGDGHGLYENLYKAFPHNLVTKPRFVGVMRCICGIESTNLAAMDDASKAMVKHLESLHYCFEVSLVQKIHTKDVQTLHINWRWLLLALKLLREPMLPESTYFWFGFQLFSSPGVLDDAPHLWISRDDLYCIFNFSASSHACSRIINQRIAQADIQLPQSVLNRSRIQYEHFCLLQDHPMVHSLFGPATPYTSYFVELMSPQIRQYVFHMRKFDKDRMKCRKFLSHYQLKSLRQTWARWNQVVESRRQARRACLRAMALLATSSRQKAFDKLCQHAMDHVAAIEIQRIFRGYRGRQQFLKVLTTLQAVLTIQRLYRDRGHFLHCVKELKRKSRQAIKIQRVYRGRLGRIQARKVLLVYFETEMATLQAQRDVYHLSVQQEAAQRIQVSRSALSRSLKQRILQRCFRKYKLHVVREQAKEDHFEYECVEREMKLLLDAAEKTRREHRVAVTAYYDQLREETLAKEARRKIDDREKFRVKLLRRQRQWADILAERKAKAEATAAAKLERDRAREEEWRQKVETRAIERKEMLLQVLLKPESKADDATKAALVARINEQYKSVRANYKAAGIAMAAQEMKDRAQHDVLVAEMEEERERVREEWRRAELAIAKQDQQDADRERMAELERQRQERQDAATRIQRGTRVCLARRLLRKKVEAAFDKIYDVASGQLVFINTRTQGMCAKPSCLGSYDLTLADKWYICPDISGDVYYYNPKTMMQSWTKPDKCVFCDSCSADFATIYCPNHKTRGYIDPQSLCAACYEGHVAQDPNLAVDATTFDGALVS
ncbi:hypothetical protein Ae201684P_008513 [Aphanomyces euteiches]|nr:hypothetical protein Ae201684P_008513 [Aphanomyces euteiches]